METDELYQSECPFGGQIDVIYAIGEDKKVYGRCTLASAIPNLSNNSDLNDEELNELRITMEYAGCPHPIKDNEPLNCKYACNDWVEI